MRGCAEAGGFDDAIGGGFIDDQVDETDLLADVGLVVEETVEHRFGGFSIQPDKGPDKHPKLPARALAASKLLSSPTPTATRVRCNSVISSAGTGWLRESEGRRSAVGSRRHLDRTGLSSTNPRTIASLPMQNRQ